MPDPSYDLTISIVNYNTFSYLENCIESIFASAGALSLEVIVVDNGSRDATEGLKQLGARFPQVRVIANVGNRYFTGAHNQALAIGRGKYFLILNPDTRLSGELLSSLVSFLREHERVGAVTCREIDGNQKPVITSTRFPTLLMGLVEWTWLRNWPLRSVLDKYLMSDWNRDTARDIEVGTGCFLMARTSLLKKFGGFDEGIKLYYSEHDLCRQIAREGFRVRFLPDVQYLHFGQRSSSQESFALIRRIHFEDMRYYFTKYHGHFGTNMMMMGIRFFRFLESMFRRLSLRFTALWAQRAIT